MASPNALMEHKEDLMPKFDISIILVMTDRDLRKYQTVVICLNKFTGKTKSLTSSQSRLSMAPNTMLNMQKVMYSYPDEQAQNIVLFPKTGGS